MTDKLSETTDIPSETTHSREMDRAKVQVAVRFLATPINPGENIGAQILKVYRRLVREGLKDIKFSRVRDFWHGDKRICVRGYERKAIEGIAQRHKLKLDIAGHARAAGEHSHEATASAARIEGRLEVRGVDRGEGRSPGTLGRETGG